MALGATVQPEPELRGSFVAVWLLVLVAAALTAAIGLGGIAARIETGDRDADVARVLMAARSAERFPAAPAAVRLGWRPSAPVMHERGQPPGFGLVVAASLDRLGPRPETVRGLGLAFTLLTLLALARAAGRGWGGWGAAWAAVVLAVLPGIAAASADLDPSGAAIFPTLMAAGSYLRYRERRSRLAATGAMAWMAAACALSWAAYLAAAPLVAHALVGGLQMRSADRQPINVSFYQFMRDSRAGTGVITFGVAWAVLVIVELGLMLALRARAGASGAVGGAAAASLLVEARARLGLAGLAVLTAWALAFVARILLGGRHPRDAALLALVLPAALGFPRFLPALAALAAVDLAALAAFRIRRAIRSPGWASAASRLAAGVLALGLAALLVPEARRAWEASRRPGSGVERLELARRIEAETTPGDLVLVLGQTAQPPLAFHYWADRDFEAIPSLGGVATRVATDRRLLLLAVEPIAPADRPALDALLREFPAQRLAETWLVDLRRTTPGIRRFRLRPVAGRAIDPRTRYLAHPDPARFAFVSAPEPWTDLVFYAEHGILPSADSADPLPAGPPPPEDRERFLAYHNLLVVRGDDPARESVRQQIAAGYDLKSPKYLSPSVWIVGTRWSFKTRTISLLWECIRPPSPASWDPTLRFVAAPKDGKQKPYVEERAAPAPLPRWRTGYLYETVQPLKLRAKGRWNLRLELVPPADPAQPRAPVPLASFAWASRRG